MARRRRSASSPSAFSSRSATSRAKACATVPGCVSGARVDASASSNLEAVEAVGELVLQIRGQARQGHGGPSGQAHPDVGLRIGQPR